jgi:hypothetical protein
VALCLSPRGLVRLRGIRAAEKIIRRARDMHEMRDGEILRAQFEVIGAGSPREAGRGTHRGTWYCTGESARDTPHHLLRPSFQPKRLPRRLFEPAISAHGNRHGPLEDKSRLGTGCISEGYPGTLDFAKAFRNIVAVAVS